MRAQPRIHRRVQAGQPPAALPPGQHVQKIVQQARRDPVEYVRLPEAIEGSILPHLHLAAGREHAVEAGHPVDRAGQAEDLGIGLRIQRDVVLQPSAVRAGAGVEVDRAHLFPKQLRVFPAEAGDVPAGADDVQRHRLGRVLQRPAKQRFARAARFAGRAANAHGRALSGQLVHLRRGEHVGIAVARARRPVDEHARQADSAHFGQRELAGEVVMIVRILVRPEQIRFMQHIWKHDFPPLSP